MLYGIAMDKRPNGNFLMTPNVAIEILERMKRVHLNKLSAHGRRTNRQHYLGKDERLHEQNQVEALNCAIVSLSLGFGCDTPNQKQE